MKLHFTGAEFQVLANVLLEASCARQAEKDAAGDAKSQAALQRRLRITEDLVAKILARDLQFDFAELDELVDILKAKKRKLGADIAQTEDSALKRDLQEKQALLESLLGRVNETCTMF